jgi:HEAT repeat protein
MPRRTPILAIILAPVALYLLVQLWGHALVPLYRTVWYSDTVLKWRLASDEPAMRISAAKDAGSWRTEDVTLLNELVASLKTDESVEVRKAAANTLGGLGSQRPLSADAIQALSELVLNEQDEAMLSAAITAVGQSAAENRYPDEVAERIAVTFSEKRLAWHYPNSARALGQIGAGQPLPDSVFVIMNSLFTDSQRPGEREEMANAFAEMAKGQSLPVTTLDMLAAAFADEPNYRIRKAILYALTYSVEDYPRAMTLITAATSDPNKDIVSTAEHGLRIIEYNQTLAGKDPLTAASDASEPLETRLNALRMIRGNKIDPAAHEQIVALAGDPETEIAVAAIEMFHWLIRSPDSDFDQRVLIPALGRSMSDPDPLIRYAAFGQLSSISRNRPGYLQVADIPTLIEAGVNDPDPKVRVVVMVMLLRDDAQREAIIERGMNDPDPYVRSNAVSWLALPKAKGKQRDAFIAEASEDPDPNVRRSAAATQEKWDTRDRAWPIELWQLWQAGERGKVGLTILTVVTIATPILVCGIFLIYFTARLLTYLQQRRWRAAAAVPVILSWAAASYGMFILYFAAGHAGDIDAREIAILAGVLWGAIAAYTALGWGLHYAIRR